MRLVKCTNTSKNKSRHTLGLGDPDWDWLFADRGSAARPRRAARGPPWYSEKRGAVSGGSDDCLGP